MSNVSVCTITGRLFSTQWSTDGDGGIHHIPLYPSYVTVIRNFTFHSGIRFSCSCQQSVAANPIAGHAFWVTSLNMQNGAACGIRTWCCIGSDYSHSWRHQWQHMFWHNRFKIGNILNICNTNKENLEGENAEDAAPRFNYSNNGNISPPLSGSSFRRSLKMH